MRFPKLNTQSIFYIHLIGSIAFFLPHFLFGHILIGNADLTDSITPIIFDQLRVALSGEIPLWNEYQYGGVPYGVYPNAHYLLPENLVLFALVPEKYFFAANTFISFVKFYLTGLFAFFTFARILKNRYWSLFASLTYQFGLYTFWQLSVFDTYSVWLYLTVALYLVYTVEKRGPVANFLVCLLVFWQVMMPNHLVTVVYAVALVAAITVIRLLTEKKLPITAYLVPLIAFVIVFLFFNARLLLVVQDFLGSNRDAGAPTISNSHTVLIMRLFVPEVYGFNFRNHTMLIQSLGFIFNSLHTHWAAPHFMGAAAIILVFTGALQPGRYNLRFWNILAILLIISFFTFHPIAMIFLLSAGNLAHHLGLAITLPFPICVAAAATGMHLFRSYRRGTNLSSRTAPIIKGLLWIVAISAVTIIAWRNPTEYLTITRIFFGALILVFVAGTIMMRDPDSQIARRLGDAGKRLQRWLPLLPAVGAVILFNEIRVMNDIATDAMILSAGILALVVICASLVSFYLSSESSFTFRRLSLLGFCAALVLLSFAWYPGELVPVDTNIKPISMFGLLGILRLVSIGQLIILLLRSGPARLATTTAVGILVAIHGLDLAASLRIHSQLSMKPFFPRTTIVPPADEIFAAPFPDPGDYRVDRVNPLAGLPYYREMYGEGNHRIGTFQFYGLRSPGGYYNAISARFTTFLSAIASKDGNRALETATRITLPGAQRLLGLKYSYREDDYLLTRSDALSRFSFYQSILPVKDDAAALELIKAYLHSNPVPTDLMRTLIVQNPTAERSNDNDAAPPARRLGFTKEDNRTYRVENDATAPGFVLFNESFNRGWRAWVNETEVPISVGQYIFMAVPVPAGRSEVVFRYEPEAYNQVLTMLKWGLPLIVLCCSAAMLFFMYHRRRRSANDLDITGESNTNPTGKSGLFARIPGPLIGILFILFLISTLQATLGYDNGLEEPNRRLVFRDYNIFPDEVTAIRASTEFPRFEVSNLWRGGGIWASVPLPALPQWIAFETRRPRLPTMLKVRLQKEHPDRGPGVLHLEGRRDGAWERIPGDYPPLKAITGWQRFPLRTENEYREYRLVFSKAQKIGAHPLTVSGIQLW